MGSEMCIRDRDTLLRRRLGVRVSWSFSRHTNSETSSEQRILAMKSAQDAVELSISSRLAASKHIRVAFVVLVVVDASMQLEHVSFEVVVSFFGHARLDGVGRNSGACSSGGVIFVWSDATT